MTVSFTVFGVAAPRGSKVVGVSSNGRRYVRDSAKKSYPWMRDVSQAAGIAMQGRPMLEGPLRLALDFFQPRPLGHYGTGRNARVLKPSAPTFPVTAPDAGKLARGTTDAMHGLCFRNDSQIVDERHRKFYGTPARCEITVTTVEEAREAEPSATPASDPRQEALEIGAA